METLYSFKVNQYCRITEEEADKHEMKFSTREQYLAWVKDWKVALKETIQSIRNEKKLRGDKTQDTTIRNGANISRQTLRIKCFNLLMIRHAGKRKGILQRNKALELVHA